MKLVPVKLEEVTLMRQGRRGRVSYPILKMFLESGEVASKIETEGVQQSFQGLYSSLRAYIQSHGLPIEMWSSGGDIYVMRTDTDDEGKINEANNDIHRAAGQGGPNQRQTFKGEPRRPNADPTGTEDLLGEVETDDEADAEFGETEAE